MGGGSGKGWAGWASAVVDNSRAKGSRRMGDVTIRLQGKPSTIAGRGIDHKGAGL